MKKFLTVGLVLGALLGFQTTKAQTLLAAKSPNRSDNHVPPPHPPKPPHPPHPIDPKPGNGPKPGKGPIWSDDKPGVGPKDGKGPFENPKPAPGNSNKTVNPTTVKKTAPVSNTVVWPAKPAAPKTTKAKK